MTLPSADELFEPAFRGQAATAQREFTAKGPGRYEMTVPTLGLIFEVDRLRRKWDELVGELTVRCDIAGARAGRNGIISSADLSFSNQRARSERARYLTKRAKTEKDDLDFDVLLDDFVLRVLDAERTGAPAVVLRDLPRPEGATSHRVEGIELFPRHPVIWFADGGTLKSYLASYVGGRLERDHGLRVGYFDWELDAEDHRLRLEQIFGADMPRLIYVRCRKPLVHEVDHLQRVIADHDINYAIFDSIGFAADGPPEAAEVVNRYAVAVRQLDIGSLHLAHTNRSEQASERPFGSTFWHNFARATWHIQKADVVPGSPHVQIALHNRKANLSALRPSVGFEVDFSDDRTAFQRVDVADVSDLAAGLPIWMRVKHAISGRPMTIAALAEELGEKVVSIEKAIQRKKKVFTRVDGTDGVSQVALLERRVS